MWFIFDFTFMCARFHWLLNSEDAKFETMSIKTENKQFFWKGPKFDVSSRTERVHAGCNFTAALLEPAPKDACKVWWVTFNADIHFQEDDWYANAAKFSVGFGLFIYAIIKMVVLFAVEMMMAAPDDNGQQQQQQPDTQPMPSSPRIPASPSALLAPNGMTAELVTPGDLAPARGNDSNVSPGGIEMTAGQLNASMVWGTEEVVHNQVLSAVGGGAAGGGAGGNAPFLGTDMPASLLPPAAAAGGGAGGHAPPLLLPPAGVVAAAGSSSSTNSRSFYDNLFLRMKKARISQGSIQ
jgi:hypothetical protein